MQARASRVHNICKADFLKLTPRQWSLIEKDYLEEWSFEKEVEDRRVARIVLAVYKASPKFKRISKTEEDFMPKKGKHSARRANESADNLYAKGIMIQNRLKAVQKHNEKIKNGS